MVRNCSLSSKCHKVDLDIFVVFTTVQEYLLILFARIGPLFQKYNAVLRFSPKPSPIDENVPSFAKTILEGLGTNRYVSTIHAIQSGVTSMAKISQIPDNRLVYRGVSVNFCTHISFFSEANLG